MRSNNQCFSAISGFVTDSIAASTFSGLWSSSTVAFVAVMYPFAISITRSDRCFNAITKPFAFTLTQSKPFSANLKHLSV